MQIETYHPRIQWGTYEGSECAPSVCKINNAVFIIFSESMEINNHFSLDMSEYNVILLGSIKAQGNININTRTMILLNNITSEGDMALNASVRGIAMSICINVKKNLYTKNMACYGIATQEKEAIYNCFRRGIQEKDGLQIFEGLVKTFEVYKPGQNSSQIIMKFLDEENESETEWEDISDEDHNFDFSL